MARPITRCPDCSHGASAHIDVRYGSAERPFATCRRCDPAVPYACWPAGGNCTTTRPEILASRPHRFVLGHFVTSELCLMCRGRREDALHAA